LIFIVAHGDRTHYVGRTRAEHDVFKIISRYPWTKRDDHSASLLTRDILVRIYSHLKDPDDMWSFMQVNRVFYRAGCFYSGYAEKIERLRVYGDPFWYIFVSNRRDIKAIKRDVAEDIIDYCFRLCRLDFSLQALTYVLTSGEVRINCVFHRGNLLGGADSRFNDMRKIIKKTHYCRRRGCYECCFTSWM
jgi:hypothetical protein